LLVLTLACVSAPVAFGASANESKAFNELTGGSGEAETTSTATTSTSSNTSVSNSQGTVLLAGGAAVVLLAGIAFVIVRDARRAAPAGGGDLVDGRPASDPAVKLRKRRAKAKAARKQRKRTR